MERIAAEPEVIMRGLMTEVAERGVAVSYGTVWNFIHREGMSFKKKRAAGRSKIAPTWRAAGRVGKNIRPGLILSVSASSMKPGSRPHGSHPRLVCAAGGSRQSSRTVTGRQ